MPRRRSPEAQALFELDESLTAQLEETRDEVLARVALIEKARRRNVHSFHGLIGGKNNTYVDSVRTKFTAPDDFKARWLRGLRKAAEAAKVFDRKATPCMIVRMLRDDLIREYTLAFLERNFYRNLNERTRDKPDESLWRLWFGDNKMTWGLIIAPRYKDGEWENDVSEIRRATYKYWTVGHILQTGLIDPTTDEPIMFDSSKAFRIFYKSILRRVSNSQYEKAIADRYCRYLRESENNLDEPFLIPELRPSLDEKHEHRLDFAILNAHTMELVGFELSPHSTHGELSGSSKKTQKEINAQLCKRWEKEMNKRNDYFSQFDITTITFTDNKLRDMDACFEAMKQYLAMRADEPVYYDEELLALLALDV